MKIFKVAVFFSDETTLQVSPFPSVIFRINSYVFNSLVISGRWESDTVKMCAMVGKVVAFSRNRAGTATSHASVQPTELPGYLVWEPGRVAQSVRHLTRKSGVLGSIPGLATYFRFSFRFFKKDSCQLLAKVCARSTG